MRVNVFVRAYVRTCVRACVRACVCACVRACVRVYMASACKDKYETNLLIYTIRSNFICGMRFDSSAMSAFEINDECLVHMPSVTDLSRPNTCKNNIVHA